MYTYDIEGIQQDIIGVDLKISDLSIKHTESFFRYDLEILLNTEIIKKYKIKDEEFDIYCEGDNIIITHPYWSLSSIGQTLQEAEINLYKEARDVLEHYSKFDPSTLSEEALKMKDFLLRII